MGDDHKFKHPYTYLISGPTGYVKSSFCIKFLKNLVSLSSEHDFAGAILWSYSESAAVISQKLTVLGKNITYHEGVPEDFDNANGRPSLAILDDLTEVYSKQISECRIYKS
jgi:hypothetical protein